MAKVVLVGTIDTKGNEYDFVRDLLIAAGNDPLVIDCGTGGATAGHVDIPRTAVAQAAGSSLDELLARNDRGFAVQTMAKGAEALVSALYAEGRLDGAMALGGTGGTSIAAQAFRALPIGIPKLIVTTAAQGDINAVVGESDIVLAPSVVDIAGLNRVSRRILANAAGAMSGMVRAGPQDISHDRPLVAAGMFGVTTAGVTSARTVLEQQGFEVLTFHMVGTGGRSLESLVRGGMLAGVLDLTTTELADELVGGIFSAGPGRLARRAERAVPRVISVGALDMVNFGPRASVPATFEGRSFYVHNAAITLMRTTPDECAELGRRLAVRVNALDAPAVVLLPLRGVSALSVAGQPFHDPEADQALFAAIRKTLAPSVELIETDTDINDSEFAWLAAETLMRLIGAEARPVP
jgi:uncharacterized protein (UPF0261 family)